MSETKSGKAVLLGRHHDVTAFCSTDASRYVIQGVHFNAEARRVEACDGHVAIRVPVCERVEDFPLVSTVSKETSDCILAPETVKKGLANISKGGVLPIVNYAQLTTVQNGEVSKATVTATDLDAEQAVTGKVIDGKYPNLDAVWPDKPATFAICLDANQLKRIAEYAVKHGVETKEAGRSTTAIRLEFTDEFSPMRFSIVLDDPLGEHPKAEGLLMPIRLA